MTIYALLAAVSAYPDGVNDLPGTLNDIDAIDAYLRSYKDVNGIDYAPLLRVDADCTRDKLVEAFCHFKQATSEDICIFYFSGHGAQMPAPPQFWHKERDRLCETIVCQDSRLPGGRDLVDKEIASLLHEYVPEGARCLVLFDSCHSGTITRDASSKVTPKNLSVNPRILAFEEFEGTYLTEDNIHWSPRKRDHIVLSACLDREVAVELNIRGKPRGLFTYSLVKTLEESDISRLNYKELLDRVQVLVANRHLGQTAFGEAVGKANMHELFLDGELVNQDLLLRYKAVKRAWILPQGTAHGISRDSSIEALVNGAYEPLLIGQVDFGMTYLQGEALGDIDATYSVRITGRKTPKLKIALSDTLSDDVKSELLASEASAREYVDFLPSGSTTRYSVKEYGENRIGLFDGSSPRPVFETVPLDNAKYVEHFLGGVNSVGRYEGIKGLKSTNRQLQLDEVVDIKIEEVFIDQDYEYVSAEEREWQQEQPIILPFKQAPGGGILPPAFKISVKVKPTYRANDGVLFVGMLIFDELYGITDQHFQMRKCTEERGWSATTSELEGEKQTFVLLNIDYNLREGWGIGSIENHIKVVVSEQDLRLQDFNQPGLFQETAPDLRGKGKEYKGTGVDPTLRRSRGKRWAVRDITFKIVYPEPLRYSHLYVDQSVRLLKVPQGFTPGRITLESSNSATRVVSTEIQPPNFSHLGLVGAELSPEREQPLTLRGGVKGKDMVVIYPAAGQALGNTSAVTQASPLRISVGNSSDNLLVLGCDKETKQYYPVGFRTTSGEVEIFHLPAPTEDEHTKSLGGSIKLFFQRIIAKRRGFPGVDLLREVVVAPDGVTSLVERDSKDESLRERVGKAKRIALFIHGIIGDNSVSPGILHEAKYDGKAIKSYYDLILTFDYENLGTSIVDIASNFQESLNDVGLVPGHGKTLHVYAHSMGGLVSRHFIELYDGDEIVSHLFQFGTPNAGSPLTTVYSYFVMGVTSLLGKLVTPYPWAAPVVGVVTWFTENTQRSLREMHIGSEYLERLNKPRDRTTPYSLVNGNTRLLRTSTKINEDSNFWERVTKGLSYSTAVDVAFFQAANDIAVSLESQQGIPGEIDVMVEVACDHMSYFISPAGANGLEVVFTKMMEKE